ncbi:hypothetical protein LCGC14_1119310, partial [marine sediment metagenome]
DDFGYVGSISHISALDDGGCFWSTWNRRTHYLYKHDPRTGEVAFFDHGLGVGQGFG